VGRLARGLLDQDACCVREAVHLLQGTERPLVRAAALEDLAALVATARPAEAVGLLDDALAVFLACGAERDGARVAVACASWGCAGDARPRGPGRPTALGSLTRAEREVVRLVADGGTNREVASRLFLSPHTVNTHLRSAFRQARRPVEGRAHPPGGGAGARRRCRPLPSLGCAGAR
jgi:DNA-binding CsgD family transcriptional regulator